jgi:hypothetical protein
MSASPCAPELGAVDGQFRNVCARKPSANVVFLWVVAVVNVPWTDALIELQLVRELNDGLPEQAEGPLLAPLSARQRFA